MGVWWSGCSGRDVCTAYLLLDSGQPTCTNTGIEKSLPVQVLTMADSVGINIVLATLPVLDIVTLSSGHSLLLEESWRQRRRHLLCLRKKNSYSKLDVDRGKLELNLSFN